MIRKETIQIIADWINTNNKLREINNYLFENTELFEEKYMDEYRQELFNFFAGKITRFTRDYNILAELLEPEELKRIRYEMIVRK